MEGAIGLLSVVFIAAILLSVVFLGYLSSKPHGLLSYPRDPDFASSCAEKIRTEFYDRLKLLLFRHRYLIATVVVLCRVTPSYMCAIRASLSFWKFSSYLKYSLYSILSDYLISPFHKSHCRVAFVLAMCQP